MAFRDSIITTRGPTLIPNDLKFRSSMTLFASITSDNQGYKDALQKYFEGELDPLTVEGL
jgi:uncharacterized protein (DUF1810 family)